MAWQRSNSNNQQSSNRNCNDQSQTYVQSAWNKHQTQSSQSWYGNNQSTIPQKMMNQQSQQSNEKNMENALIAHALCTENESLKKQLKNKLNEYSTARVFLNKQISQLKNQNKQTKEDNIKLKKENQSLASQLCQLEKRLAQYEVKENQIYIRNTIWPYNSKHIQDIKPQCDIDNKQKDLQTLFDENEANMTNWMTFTEKMNETYNKCKNIISKNNSNIALWTTLMECKTLWQQQQNQMELIVQKLAQLQKKKTNLKNCVTGHNNAIQKQNENYKQELNTYDQTHATRIKLENQLKAKLKKLNECCDKENKLNENKCILLDDLNRFNIELKEYELLLKYCNKLMKQYREFDSVNEVTITDMEHYFTNKWKENMKIWYEWSPESIVYWLKYLRENGTLILSGNLKFDKILKQMETNDVNGKVFETIDKNDLQSIGFEILSDRQNVFVEIQELILKYPQKLISNQFDDEGKNDDTMKNEGNIPEDFKCPISKQIMNEPVLIFDGYTYEKANIEKYLNEHQKSPKTNEICDEDDKWFTPNRPLKQKIMAFLKVNPQFKVTNYIL